MALEKYRTTRFKAKDSKYSRDHADYAVNFIECLSHTKGTYTTVYRQHDVS